MQRPANPGGQRFEPARLRHGEPRKRCAPAGEGRRHQILSSTIPTSVVRAWRAIRPAIRHRDKVRTGAATEA